MHYVCAYFLLLYFILKKGKNVKSAKIIRLSTVTAAIHYELYMPPIIYNYTCLHLADILLYANNLI